MRELLGRVNSSSIFSFCESIENAQVVSHGLHGEPENLSSDKVFLKTKDKAIVEFKFVSHPEFIEKNIIFFFREGTTRGVGRVI